MYLRKKLIPPEKFPACVGFAPGGMFHDLIGLPWLVACLITAHCLPCGPKLPSKQMYYMLNSRKFFYVTYVMHYMIITYSYSLKIFRCKGGLY